MERSQASEPGEGAQPGGESPGPRGRGRRGPIWARYGMLALFIALVALPVMVRGIPREVARWYQAAAVEHYLDERLDEARRSLEQALVWAPHDARLYLLRADWEEEAGEYDAALASCQQALEVGALPLRVLLERSEILWHAGRWSEALEVWKEIAQAPAGTALLPEVSRLNGLAYARALANTELEDALRDARRAVELAQSQDESSSQLAALLDTRGYVQYRRESWHAARADFDTAIRLLEAGRSPGDRYRDVEDPREARRNRRHDDRTLAALLYHRLLVLEKLAATVEAEADRARIRELGWQPDDSLF